MSFPNFFQYSIDLSDYFLMDIVAYNYLYMLSFLAKIQRISYFDKKIISSADLSM